MAKVSLHFKNCFNLKFFLNLFFIKRSTRFFDRNSTNEKTPCNVLATSIKVEYMPIGLISQEKGSQAHRIPIEKNSRKTSQPLSKSGETENWKCEYSESANDILTYHHFWIFPNTLYFLLKTLTSVYPPKFLLWSKRRISRSVWRQQALENRRIETGPLDVSLEFVGGEKLNLITKVYTFLWYWIWRMFPTIQEAALGTDTRL